MTPAKAKRSASKRKAAQAPDKTGKPEPVRATHAFMTTEESADGIKREIHIARFPDSRYGVTIRTIWPDAEPLVTRISLSPIGFGLLSSAIMEAVMNMERWRVDDSSRSRSDQCSPNPVTES